MANCSDAGFIPQDRAEFWLPIAVTHSMCTLARLPHTKLDGLTFCVPSLDYMLNMRANGRQFFGVTNNKTLSVTYIDLTRAKLLNFTQISSEEMTGNRGRSVEISGRNGIVREKQSRKAQENLER